MERMARKAVSPRPRKRNGLPPMLPFLGEEDRAPMQIPTSTYRLQFRDGMTFDKAAGLVPYWQALGISHLYASPIFSATSGSTHGYDVTDANRIDPVLGGREAFERLAQALKGAGISLLLDIVPNHMAASLENPWWQDVIEWGHASRFANHFDIDWEQRLTLPFLGQPFKDVAEAGEITLVADRQKGFLAFNYFDQHYPLNPSTYLAVLRDSDTEGARSVMTLAEQSAAEAEEIFHAALRALLSGPAGEEIDAVLSERSADPAFLVHLHDLQSWKLMDWRLAPQGLSYRRFFEVAGLVGLRVEDPQVFEAVHAKTFALLDEGLIQGLRIDHVDGLADPGAYLAALRQRIGPETYLVIEKILGEGELLPPEWPVEGTTGYEFITALNTLLADRSGVDRLEQAYLDLSPRAKPAKDEFRDTKSLMIRVNFSGEVNTLLRLAAKQLGASSPFSAERDGPLGKAVEELLIAFPVYRTYSGPSGQREADGSLLKTVAAQAAQHLDKKGREALQALLGLLGNTGTPDALRLVTRFQQLTGPLMAKALEDTLFYRHNAFLAFNEVGGMVMEKGQDLPDFHGLMLERLASEPHGVNATSTHDTKRGEDARARLLALSEDPEPWIEAVKRWMAQQAKSAAGTNLPEPDVQWLIYQALLGVWPAGDDVPSAEVCTALEERLHDYLDKAMREAKLATNWSGVNEAYEQSVKDYASGLLGKDGGDFRKDFSQTVQTLIKAGALNSLSQTILKLTAPGVPDIYQGSEQLDLSLVDPDNRRQPDFSALASALETASGVGRGLAWSEDGLLDGTMKQAVIQRMLACRRENPDLFNHGTYHPLAIEGQNRAHLLGFIRQHEGKTLLVVIPRLTLKLETAPPIDETAGRTRVLLPDELLEHEFFDLFTGRTTRFPDRDGEVSHYAAQGFSLMISQP